jgi:opine dehydrogenase
MEPWFWDVNMVLHPPGMILGAARIEATGGDFHFYGNGITSSVEAVMTRLDEERIAVARGFGVEVPSLAASMAVIGTAVEGAAREGRLGDAIRGGAANAAIKAPPRLDHRYLHEDIPFGLVPLVALGRIGGVSTPVADALIELAQAITGRAYREEGLDQRALGIAGATVEEVVTIAERRA